MVEGGLDAQPCTLILLIFGISCCWYLESFVGTIIHRLKGGYRKKNYSFIGPLGHNIWWEKRRNGSFGPKNGPKLQN